jgi:adenine deaminase
MNAGARAGQGPGDARPLVDVAMGRATADLVVRDGRWACVQTGEIVEHTDVAVWGGRIAYVGPDARHCIGPRTTVIEAEGMHLVPGLLDGHMHVESGMLTVTELVRAVLPHGTTGLFADPHEIANVLGVPGVRLMVDEAARQPIHVFLQAPSCVPSAPGLETPGAVIGPAEIEQILSWPGVVGLGEMMNFPGVIMAAEGVHAEMAATRSAGKVIGGHYASPDLGPAFHAYAAGGAQDDHEGTRLEDAVARARQGMRVMLRYGSAWHDVAAQAPAIVRDGLDPRRFILCTDDSHSQTLSTEGHMDRVVRHAVSQGIKPMTALQMATINTAEHFGVDRDMGMIAPGRWADVLLVKDLSVFTAHTVIARGVVAASEGRLLVDLPAASYPAWAMSTVKIPRALTAGDFELPAPGHDGEAAAHVIGVIENQAPNRHLTLKVPVRGGLAHPDITRDIAKVALVDRHRASGRVQVGFAHGFGFTAACAVATTVAHDCHQLVVVGTDETQMAVAANAAAACGGGQIVVKDGVVIGKVELPIAGLMSDKPAPEVARQAATVLRGFKECGCPLNNPNMQMSLMALVVIPELRLLDLGLIDVTRFAPIPVIDPA